MKGEPRPKEDQEDYPQYELTEEPKEEWRCASCYRTRYKTMCFGLNDAGARQCAHCGKAPLEAGYTVWVHYSDLPPPMQGLIERNYGHKLTAVLRTLFLDVTVKYTGKIYVYD